MSFNAIQRTLGSNPKGKLSMVARFGALAAVALLGASGCVATVRPEPVAVTYDAPVVEAEVVPTDIATYPRVYYNGNYAYLVDGSWYYPSARGWMVYRSEPVELRQHRGRIYSAPNAYSSPRVYTSPRYDRSPTYSYPRSSPRELGRERTPR